MWSSIPNLNYGRIPSQAYATQPQFGSGRHLNIQYAPGRSSKEIAEKLKESNKDYQTRTIDKGNPAVQSDSEDDVLLYKRPRRRSSLDIAADEHEIYAAQLRAEAELAAEKKQARRQAKQEAHMATQSQIVEAFNPWLAGRRAKKAKPVLQSKIERLENEEVKLQEKLAKLQASLQRKYQRAANLTEGNSYISAASSDSDGETKAIKKKTAEITTSLGDIDPHYYKASRRGYLIPVEQPSSSGSASPAEGMASSSHTIAYAPGRLPASQWGAAEERIGSTTIRPESPDRTGRRKGKGKKNAAPNPADLPIPDFLETLPTREMRSQTHAQGKSPFAPPAGELSPITSSGAASPTAQASQIGRSRTATGKKSHQHPPKSGQTRSTHHQRPSSAMGNRPSSSSQGSSRTRDWVLGKGKEHRG